MLLLEISFGGKTPLENEYFGGGHHCLVRPRDSLSGTTSSTATSIPAFVCSWRAEPGSVAQLCQPHGWTRTRAASGML